MTDKIQELQQRIDGALLQDRYPLRRQLAAHLAQKGATREAGGLQKIEKRLARSLASVQQRQSQRPAVSYADELPISQKRAEIAKLIEQNQVVVIAGETGSGKTTQIPKICLELGRGIYGMIGHTQPRRLAARTVAARVAEELQVALGQQVGYQVRFSDQVSEQTQIKLMTDGILLAQTQHDPYLNAYDTLIIDEAHERSLNIDFLLGYVKRLLPKRPDLKVIITSATIDLERFSRHFDDAPVIEVSGRTYPVELDYQPLSESEERGGDSLVEGVLNAVESIRARPRRLNASDILVFLPGEREIRDLAHALKGQNYAHMEVLPLYARLSNKEQNRVFQPHTGQRIVLATNVAETSLTVPGIGYVIDPGLARISRYSPRSKVQRLPVEAISQASANQRKGRCGRVAEGFCIRLYAQEDFDQRPEFTDAEILRTNLAAVILQMLHLRLGEVERFPFIDPPDRRAIKDGFELLHELGAVDARRRITALGRQIARFPVDPRIGRMVLAASHFGSLQEVLIIASALTIQDPRERPLDKQQAADEKHRAYQDEHSDFIALLNLWRTMEAQRQELSQNQFKRYCRTQFLSFLRILEWRDVHRQLLLVCKEMGLKINQEPADYAAIHRALLAGLLGHIGEKQESSEYKGALNRSFYLFPGSGIFKKTPKWIMAAEIVETSKLYARMAARIEPEWIEPQAQHLVKRSYFEPHWEKRRGQVVAYEQVTLYGLVIVARRALDYGKIDASEARALFIMQALVAGELHTKANFYGQNQATLLEVQTLEDKSRRRDILIDDTLIYQFYDERLPAEVHSANTLQAWLKTAKTHEAQRLLITRDYLMQHGAAEITAAQYPDTLECAGKPLALSYAFNPGSDEDGVTLTLPLGMLNQISAEQLEWLVPGMLREKCVVLLKSLPKSYRKNFVPVPDYIDRAFPLLQPGRSLTQALAAALKRVSGVDIPDQAWDAARIDDFYRMRLRVIDERQHVVGQGRDIMLLRQQFQNRIGASLKQSNQESFERSGITTWDFGALFRQVPVAQAGMTVNAVATLVDQGDSVSLQLVDTRVKAEQIAIKALLRLLMLATSQEIKYLRKNISISKQVAVYYTTIGSFDELFDDFIAALYKQVFLTDQPLPTTQQEFEQCLADGKGKLVKTANQLAQTLSQILTDYHKIATRVRSAGPKAWHFVYQDVEQQLGRLIYVGFVYEVPWDRLHHYPRYLKAIQLRLDRIQNQLDKEKTWCGEMQDLWCQYEAIKERAANAPEQHDEVTHLRWLLEEYRVSLYAQTLGTTEPVSHKRIEKYMAKFN